MNSDHEETTVLPSQLNWLEMARSLEGTPPRAIHEHVLYSDAYATGDFRPPDAPYAFLNTVPMPSTSVAINAAIVLRTKMYMTGSMPDMSQTNETLYHGGLLVDELVALASLLLGIRLHNGGMSREFGADSDPYGRPCEWDRAPRPLLQLRRNGPILPAARGSSSLDQLQRLDTITKIEPKRYVSLIRACRSYQEALWVAESEPNLAWLLLVSAIETAANDMYTAETDVSEQLRAVKPELAAHLEKKGGSELVRVVADEIAHTLRATKKFLDFVMRFRPPPPSERPEEKFLRLRWTLPHLKKVFRKVYEYRSRALHAGVPFPVPMLDSPFSRRVGGKASEVPLVGLGTYSTGGTWVPEDVPINLHSFHYIARQVLLNWWEKELVQAT